DFYGHSCFLFAINLSRAPCRSAALPASPFDDAVFNGVDADAELSDPAYAPFDIGLLALELEDCPGHLSRHVGASDVGDQVKAPSNLPDDGFGDALLREREFYS